MAWVAADGVLPYWRDVQVTSVNTLPPHAAFMTYANRAQALTGRYLLLSTQEYRWGFTIVPK